jgi:hypothetical protein
MNCENSGAKLPDDSVACDNSEARVIRIADEQPGLEPGAIEGTKNIVEAAIVQENAFAAPTAAGELDLGEVELSGLETLGAGVTEVPGAVEGISRVIGSYIGGIHRIFTNRAYLIGVVVLAVLWFVLAWFRDSDSWLVKLLSWLTFSEGGFNRSFLGMVGGALGKGVVAAGLFSLLHGGISDALKGIVGIFTGDGGKLGIVETLFGILIGVAAYFAFVGASASANTSMAGIAGALLSLEAFGSGKGKLYELSQSLTSRSVNGIRTVMQGKCDGLLIGLTLGFAFATTLGILKGQL